MHDYTARVGDEAVITETVTCKSIAVQIPGHHIGQVLGTGANGIAFRGTDPLDRDATIKIWPPRLTRQRNLARVQEQALAETKKVAGLRHEAIGIVYQFGRLPNGWPFTVAEHAPGASLKDLAGAQLEESLRRVVVTGVLTALRHAERRGVLHGDLHLGNVIYDDKWATRGRLNYGESLPPIARIIDFGTSAFAGREPSPARHARLLKQFVFDLWPELTKWLVPLPALAQRRGFDMLPALSSAVHLVSMVEHDRTEPKYVLVVGGKPEPPRERTHPFIVGHALRDVVDFDRDVIFRRLAETYTRTELEECRASMLVA